MNEQQRDTLDHTQVSWPSRQKKQSTASQLAKVIASKLQIFYYLFEQEFDLIRNYYFWCSNLFLELKRYIFSKLHTSKQKTLQKKTRRANEGFKKWMRTMQNFSKEEKDQYPIQISFARSFETFLTHNKH